ncbi:hypothetical protein, partial [Hominenteromicrobium sp.]|uniref:hypothetical protein n=1 Tax=Hominenteromicrobium sp. TaxID=3073581 RepID=UPI003AEFF96A
CQVLHRLPYGQNAAGMIQSGCTSHTLYGCTAYLSIAIPHSVLNFSVFLNKILGGPHKDGCRSCFSGEFPV